MNNQKSRIIFLCGGVLTIVGALMQMFDHQFAPYVFSVGAAIIIYVQLIQYFDRPADDNRQQRLIRTSLYASLLLALAAYFMFVGSNSWVVAVLIYSLSSLIVTFRGK